MKTAIETNEAPAPIGPYNQAILANGTLYISGQVAINPATGEVELGELEDEVHLVMKNLGGVLKEAGMDYSNIVKTSIFIMDMGDFGRINEVYGSYFTDVPPARETVQVAALPKGVRVEISAIAVQS